MTRIIFLVLFSGTMLLPVWGAQEDGMREEQFAQIARIQVRCAHKCVTYRSSGMLFVTVINDSANKISATIAPPVYTESIILDTVPSQKPDTQKTDKPDKKHKVSKSNLPPTQLSPVSFPVESGGTVTKRYTVRSGQIVQPGEQIVLIPVTVEWTTNGVAHRRSAVLSYQLSADLIGESEVLVLLGIPSFLVLPGFLLLITASYLINLHNNREDRHQLLRDHMVNPGFWVLGLTISGASAFLYPILTHRDYLSGYGLFDLIFVWLGSIGLGVVVAGGYYSYIYGKSAYYTYLSSKLMPGDSALLVLYKLQRRGITSVSLPLVQITSDENTSFQGFLPHPDDLYKLKVPVFSSMCLKKKLITGRNKNYLEEADEAYNAAANAIINGEVSGILEELTHERLQRYFILKWEGAYPGVHYVPSEKVRNLDQTRACITRI